MSYTKSINNKRDTLLTVAKNCPKKCMETELREAIKKYLNETEGPMRRVEQNMHKMAQIMRDL